MWADILAWGLSDGLKGSGGLSAVLDATTEYIFEKILRITVREPSPCLLRPQGQTNTRNICGDPSSFPGVSSVVPSVGHAWGAHSMKRPHIFLPVSQFCL